MLQNKKSTVLLGLVAAYAIYKYSTMSADEKESLKTKGRQLLENYLPDDLKQLFGITAGTETTKTSKKSFEATM